MSDINKVNQARFSQSHAPKGFEATRELLFLAQEVENLDLAAFTDKAPFQPEPLGANRSIARLSGKKPGHATKAQTVARHALRNAARFRPY